MQLKSIRLSLVCMIGLTGTMFAASSGIEYVRTDVIPGEWTSNYSAARKYAEDNGVPMFIIWSNPGCAHCKKVKAACNESDFVQWRKERKYILVVSEGEYAVKSFIKSLKGGLSGKYPFMGIYWPKGGVSEKFNGYPYNNIWSTGATIQAKIMNRVDARLAAWINGNFDPGSGTSDSGTTPTPTPTPSVPTPGAEWKRARTLVGSYFTSDGLVVGRIVMKAGRMNNKGVAKIKVSVTDTTGKSKNSSQKTFTADATTKGTISGAFGTYAFSITGNNISGTLTVNGKSYEVKPLATGGAIADGTLTFSLLEYPESCQGNDVIDGEKYLPLDQKFTTKSSRWSFARKGMLRYDRKTGKFAMSNTDNPSGLKLSYKTSNGFFKGTFTIYAQRSATTSRQYKATVTGFMVGGSGAGVATVRNVGSYSCTIKDEATLEAERIAAEQAAEEQAVEQTTDEEPAATDKQ